MFKNIIVLLVIVHIVITQNLQQNATILITNLKNLTQQADKNIALINKNEISNKNNASKENETKNLTNNKIEKVSDENNQFIAIEPTGDLDDFNFKYYWILLVGSSLAIISLIVFRSFRLRRSRAEVRYGRATDSEEIEPFSKSKWDNDESSENEDEIFDINFLKNTRLQTHSDL